MSNILEKTVSQATKAHTEIGRIEIGLFNRVIINDFLLYDQKGDTLLYASKLSASIDLVPLLKGRLSFSAAQLFNPLINLSRDDTNNNNQINLNKRFSEMIYNKKYQIQLDKKLKIDTMTIKFAGIDLLTKEASLIKTQEIEKDLPEVKLFDKFVSFIQRRKINQLDLLIQKNEEVFNRILNKQEFSTGNTLLIYATQNNLKSLVELLLLKGADPNLQNKFGNSALHIAYKNDNAFIINLLLEYNAEQKLKNTNGFFPWQMAKSINN